MKDISKETTIPTAKGEEIGIYSERAGVFPNEYYRIFYNEQAQLFLVQNFRKILTESVVIHERLRKERREQRGYQRPQEKSGAAGSVQNDTVQSSGVPGSDQEVDIDGFFESGWEKTAEELPW
jgi:hypothetical protein